MKAIVLLLVFLVVAAFGGSVALSVPSSPIAERGLALAGNGYAAASVGGAIIQPCGEELDCPGMPT